jgi:hypothetical protein
MNPPHQAIKYSSISQLFLAPPIPFFHTLSFASSSRSFKIDLPRPGLLASILNRPSSCPDWLVSTLPWINPFVLVSKRTTWPRVYVAVAAAPRYTILGPYNICSLQRGVSMRRAGVSHSPSVVTSWRWCSSEGTSIQRRVEAPGALSWWKFYILVLFKKLFYK